MMALRSTLRCVLVKAQQQEELEAACYIVSAVRNKRAEHQCSAHFLFAI